MGEKIMEKLMIAVSALVFIFLDFLDIVFCKIYRIIDKLKDGKSCECYCYQHGKIVMNNDDKESEISETLYMRKNFFKDLRFCLKKIGVSDCVELKNISDLRLHVVVKEPSPGVTDDCKGKSNENVIFLHGLFSSSTFWTQTVYPNLSEPVKQNYRLFAVDLLGFGKSPMPENCMYTLRDQLIMIEKSVICPFELNSFHLVAHSMGCIVALALAAKYSLSVKSITLVAPPCFPSRDGASLIALNVLGERKIWPLIAFGGSLCAWYQHLGRCVFFLSYGKHWEWIFKMISSEKSTVPMVESTRHYHNAGWHTMHNLICGGANLTDTYLNVLSKGGIKISVIHGDKDLFVSLDCIHHIKMKVHDLQVHIIPNADHTNVILGRIKDFTEDLERTWLSTARINSNT